MTDLMGRCVVSTADCIRLSGLLPRDEASRLASLTQKEHPEWGPILVLQVVEQHFAEGSDHHD